MVKGPRDNAAVRITAGAERDLADIYHRRMAQRGSAGGDGADALLDTLTAAMEDLAEFPLKGPVPVELEMLGIHDFRQISLPPYRIVYLPEPDARRVTVMLVADSRRDFRSLLEARLLRTQG